MPSSGGTTGTPSTPTPPPASTSQTKQSIAPLLSMPRYGRIMRLDPLHFAGGFSSLRPERGCEDIFYQYDWQDNDKVSRDSINQLLLDAERDLADELGWWPAPRWIQEERHVYTHPQRTDIENVLGIGARNRVKSIETKRGWVISGGIRAESYLGTTSFTFLDADGDGFDEWAVFALTVASGLDACEVRAYFKEYDASDAENCRTDPSSGGADDAWEIRPIDVNVTSTTLTVRIHTWELFKPQLSESHAPEPIDADDLDSYVDEIMFYQVYNDPSDQVTFGWSNEIDCDSPACAWSTQTGCIKMRDSRRGVVIPEPGTYDATNDEYTAAATWAEYTEPDLVWLNYYAGYKPEFNRGCDPLDEFWAKVIARLATARLDVPLCSCDSTSKTVAYLTTDLAETSRTTSFQNSLDVLQCPFGTRRGEVEAWRHVKKRGVRKGGTVKY